MKKKVDKIQTNSSLISNTEAGKIDVEAFKALVREAMPEFIRDVETKEDAGNAMMRIQQEWWLILIDALIRHHGWKEQEISSLMNEMKKVGTGVAEYEKHGLNISSPYSIDIVSDHINTVMDQERTGRIGLAIPITEPDKSLLKKLVPKK